MISLSRERERESGCTQLDHILFVADKQGKK